MRFCVFKVKELSKLCKSALQEIATDNNQTKDTRNHAKALAKQMDTKEVTFMHQL